MKQGGAPRPATQWGGGAESPPWGFTVALGKPGRAVRKTQMEFYCLVPGGLKSPPGAPWSHCAPVESLWALGTLAEELGRKKMNLNLVVNGRSPQGAPVGQKQKPFIDVF